MTAAVTVFPVLSPTSVVGRAGVSAVGTWERLACPGPEPVLFDPSLTDGLPEPVRRWLNHAIAPGTRLARAVVVEMQGRIRIGRWMPFRAVQLHAPPDGYVWAARATIGPLAITGFDRYADGTGEMRWQLLGRIPVMHASGPDLDRSAAGRVALDAFLVPTAFLSPAITWAGGADPDTATAKFTVDDHSLMVEFTVDADGAVRSVTMPRWGNPNGRPFGEYPCGGTLDDEVDFGGIKIPTRIRAGWFFGTDDWPEGEFFRAEVTSATFI